jgi:hypothetical protein
MIFIEDIKLETYHKIRNNNKKRIAYKIKKLNNINKDETSLYLRYRIKNCDVLYQNEIIEKIA